MLCVYAPDCTDFSGNGLGTLSPSGTVNSYAQNRQQAPNMNPINRQS